MLDDAGRTAAGCRRLSIPLAALDKSAIALLSLAFALPWIYWTGPHQIKVKEAALVMAFTFFCLRSIYLKRFGFDLLSRLLLVFIMACIFFLIMALPASRGMPQCAFLVHIFLFALYNFLIYVMVYNFYHPSLSLKMVRGLFFVFYLFVAVYLFWVGDAIHGFAMENEINYYTAEAMLYRQGRLMPFIGGSNGRAWFFLILTAFWVGDLTARRKLVPCFAVITLAFLVSSLMLSRAPLLFLLLLLAYAVFSLFKASWLKRLVLLPVFFFMVQHLIMPIDAFYDLKEKLVNKITASGLSHRDKLLYEGLAMSINYGFWGRGFHYTAIHKESIWKLGYLQTARNNPQNTYIAMLVELGIVGVLAYTLFWVVHLKKFFHWSALGEKDDRAFFKGSAFLALFVMIAFCFAHHYEKNMTAMPIFMILLAMANKRCQLILKKMA